MNSKKMVSILFAVLLAITLAFPMNVTAQTCDITFNDAHLFLEDGTTIYQSITVMVDQVAHATPFTLTFDVCVEYNVNISAVIERAGRYYRHWTELEGIDTQCGWNYIGDVEIRLISATDNGHLVFHFHCLEEGSVSVEPKYARAGPKIDVMRMPVIRSPDAALIAMQTEVADVWGSLSSPMDVFSAKLAEMDGLLRAGDIEKLDADGFTITYNPGYHIGHIGYNIRPLEVQQERRPELTCWPLADVEFRHALFHCHNQEWILAAIYAYTVMPIYDLIPPAQGGWLNPAVPHHPYNPGNPFISTPSDGTSCGILMAAGYAFVDAGTIGVVDEADYWQCPNGEPVPNMRLFTPTYETAPTSAEYGAIFVADLGEIGLAATLENGYHGIEHQPAEFNWYMRDMVDYGEFDLFMVFWNLDMFPDHLYDMCHSSQDAWEHPGRNNLPGINDPTVDTLVETLKTSLSHAQKLAAAHEVQELLYDPEASDQALAYMPLYSKIYFNAFNPDLRGIVTSPGYGSHNKWTSLNIHWEPGTERYTEEGRTVTDWILGEQPETLNPLSAETKYSWAIMSQAMDGLIMRNPYTHEDEPWMAESWETAEYYAVIAGEGYTCPYADNDAYDMYDVLTSYTNWNPSNIRLLVSAADGTKHDCTRTNIINEIAWMISVADENDVCVFFYAGHGGYTPDVPPFDEDDLLDEYICPEGGDILDDELDMWMSAISGSKLVALDSCFSGGFIRAGGLRSRSVPDLPRVEITDGFARDLNKPGWNVHTACDEDEFAFGTGELENGVFTYYFVEGLSGEADSDADGDVDASEAHDYTRPLVQGYTMGDQNPQFFCGTPDPLIWVAPSAMNVTFHLRRDIFWQDGNPYTAHDAAFNWLFLRDNEIPRYASTWKYIQNVVVIDDYTVRVVLNVTSQFLPYDLAATAAMLPPQVWADWNGLPLVDILARDLSVEPGWNGVTPTNLFGTGPFVFDYYDEVNLVAQLHQFPGYFRTTVDIQDQKVEMFHRCGDVNYDGTVWADDRGLIGLLFGTFEGIDPEYDPDVDVNSDGCINIVDISLANYFFGEQREWP